MKITVDLIGGNTTAKFINQFMHAGDVFEKGKYFVTCAQLEIDGTPDLNQLIPNIVKAWESKEYMNGYVVFAAINSIDKKRCIEPRPYLKEGVQTLSMHTNGKLVWCLFRDYLKCIGYKPIVDKNMSVTDVIFPNYRTMLNKTDK
jgi:hypothetical protein